jgi:DNA repair protein RadC
VGRYKLLPLLHQKGDPTMKKKCPTRSSPSIQDNLFEVPQQDQPASKFISVYRVSLVKDKSVSFEKRCLSNSVQARPILRKLIEAYGQPDREQFCVLLLNAKNEIIGLNIVSTGCLTSTTVHPREVLKPAIIANSAAMILCHNHPSNDPAPSQEDIAVTKNIVQAAKIMGIQVHEHLIINMDDDRYYSFADHGLIQSAYDAIT